MDKFGFWVLNIDPMRVCEAHSSVIGTNRKETIEINNFTN